MITDQRLQSDQETRDRLFKNWQCQSVPPQFVPVGIEIDRDPLRALRGRGPLAF